MKNTKPLPPEHEAEKIFLHDLSSPLMIAMGWLERWQRRDSALPSNEEFLRLTEQLEKLQNLVAKRRDLLLQRERDS